MPLPKIYICKGLEKCTHSFYQFQKRKRKLYLKIINTSCLQIILNVRKQIVNIKVMNLFEKNIINYRRRRRRPSQTNTMEKYCEFKFYYLIKGFLHDPCTAVFRFLWMEQLLEPSQLNLVIFDNSFQDHFQMALYNYYQKLPSRQPAYERLNTIACFPS